MEVEKLERRIEHHRSEMLRFCYRASLVETETKKIEKAILRAKGHETEVKRLLEKKKRLLLLKTSK